VTQSGTSAEFLVAELLLYCKGALTTSEVIDIVVGHNAKILLGPSH
jgi:hypothetical protein